MNNYGKIDCNQRNPFKLNSVQNKHHKNESKKKKNDTDQ